MTLKSSAETYSGRSRAFLLEETSTTPTPLWQHLAIAATLLLSAFLNFFRLGQVGYSFHYYAATVKSMLTSWHNFFFASFDPGGFVSVDKPPLGLWIQAASAELFGFQGLSLVLPQALAGVLSVAVLYHLVRRVFGPLAGILSALALAVTPITVAIDRSNEVDSLLVLSMLLAAWALILAAQTGSLRWLLLSVVIVGLGFNIKMVEAFLPLPAFYLTYLVSAPLRWRTRLLHLAIATGMLLCVSLSWALVVDLTPADQRPYVATSSNNTMWDLIANKNGRERAQLGNLLPWASPSNSDSGIEELGLLRLLNNELAGQISWTLPLAVIGLLAACWQAKFRFPLNRGQQALLLWGMWFLTEVIYFSLYPPGHSYYLVVLGPPTAALVGVGVMALWHNYQRPNARGWLLPMALVTTAAVQAYFLVGHYPDWGRLLTPLILGVCILAAVVLLAARLRAPSHLTFVSALAAVVGTLALLIAPTVWAAASIEHKDLLALNESDLSALNERDLVRAQAPYAGPDEPPERIQLPWYREEGLRTANSLSAPADPRLPWHREEGLRTANSLSATADPQLVDYLEANRGGARFLMATSNSMLAAPLIIDTGEPVMTLGGYYGSVPILTPTELVHLIDDGDVRFFLLWDGANLREGMQTDVQNWVREICPTVPPQLWQSTATEVPSSMSDLSLDLYDCSKHARQIKQAYAPTIFSPEGAPEGGTTFFYAGGPDGEPYTVPTSTPSL